MRASAKPILVVGLVAVLGATYAMCRDRDSERAELKLVTQRVDRGDITAKVSATGTLSALVTVQVGSQVSGRIQQLMVDFNSPVKKGEVIAKIDPQLFQAAVEQARANFVAAQGDSSKSRLQAEDAQRQLARTKSLAERKLIATAELDTAASNAAVARAQVEAAEGKVAQARAALRQAEVNLAYTDIASPITGVVISRNVDVGQTVAASLQAPTLFVIAEDLAKMQVNTSVAEADVGKLTAGMAAFFTVDAYPAQRFDGSVRQVRNSPQTVDNVVTYDAVIDVANPDLKLKPGMTANVTFVYSEAKDVVRIPNAALRFRPSPELLQRLRGGDQSAPPAAERASAPPPSKKSRPVDAPGTRTIWVQRGAEAAPMTVRTGITDGSMTELAEGDLHEGDPVITDVDDASKRSQPPSQMGRGPFRGF